MSGHYENAPASPRPDARPPAAASPLLQGLNPEQREAVEATEGPVLVLAGAGTGKTRVLTTRLAYLIERGVHPGRILTVTFTNRAAREMRERVAAMIGAPTEGWWMGTFHALAARILRRHAEEVGLKPSFGILDTDDQLRIVKQLIEAESIDSRRWPARALLGAIERWKDRGLTPDRLKPEDAGDLAGGRMVALYSRYQERLRTLNACDFGDLLLHNITIFQARPEILADWQQRFRYILVDEYQDTNVAQYLWLRLLAQTHRNLCCVGDDDQSIYSWRGAEIGNILRFEQDFPGARVIRLERNYRSTQPILAAASGLIAHNRGRLGKTLFTDASGGEAITVHAVWDGEAEARWVGERIEALQREGVPLSQIAILVRAGFQMREFEERFLTLGLPYRVIGGPRFYERQEIRDAVAYLRLVARPDDDLAFERIVNVPKRGLGDATLQTIHALARATGLPLAEAAARIVETDELKPRPRGALRSLIGDFDRWRALAENSPAGELVRIVLDESGYTRMWQAETTPDAAGRLDNLKELVGAVETFESLTAFLEHVALVMENETAPPGEQVVLMTLHAAKGLEFDHVFLPGWEEGVFPNQRALDESGIAGLEEERRLAYVGLTRARRQAYVVTAANRRIHGTWQAALPSRFVGELPEDQIRQSSELGPDPDVATSRPSRLWTVPAGFGAPRPRQPITIEGTGYVVTERQRPTVPYVRGDRVFHQKFGYGTVRDVDSDKLTIDFDATGEKRVVDSFVKPAAQAG